jgi:hypothetical protein
MALKHTYEAQTDIPSALQEHYGEKDGKWVLQLDPPAEDVTGLKNALSQERVLRRDAEKQLVEVKTKYEGIDPEEVIKLRDRVKGLDDADIYDKQGIEVLIARRTESMKQDHERHLNTLRRENDQLKTTNGDLDRRWRQDRIRTALLDAVSKSGVHEKAVEDAVRRGLTVFNELDEQGNVVAKQGDDLTFGKDGVNALSPSEWIATLKTSGQASHLWGISAGGGAPALHGGNGGGIDYSKLPPEERLTAIRAARAAGRGI